MMSFYILPLWRRAIVLQVVLLPKPRTLGQTNCAVNTLRMAPSRAVRNSPSARDAMKMSMRFAVFLALAPMLAQSFAVRRSTMTMSDPLRNFFRSQRGVAAGDRNVEIKKPLGIVLEEDEKGNVYVASITPGGNAARTNKVNVGDQVVMCSATFGDEMWSTRGSGLYSVMNAVKVRQGDSIRLVLENASDSTTKKEKTKRQLEQEKKAAELAQARKDALLAELEATDAQLREKRGFFGLF